MTPEQIKHLRYSILHLTQPEFAKVMGTCVATISRWEGGRAKPAAMAQVIMSAIQKAVDNHGEERIRGIDWSDILEKNGLLVVLRGILSFATTMP
jgi:transcriptional regulator with XRE-family HTH domain